MAPVKLELYKAWTVFWSQAENSTTGPLHSQERSGPVVECSTQDQRGRGFEPHRRHCVVSLSKTHLSLLSTGSTQKDLSQHNWKIVDWDVKNQIKQNCAPLDRSRLN